MSTPSTMRAVGPYSAAHSGIEMMDLPVPEPGPGEVLIGVEASALNRADLIQMKGHYPPPPGESEIPGLECAGRIVALGGDCEGWRVGDEVMALLAGGGQAEWAVAPVGQLLRKPAGWSWSEAGGLMEVAITSWTNLVYEGRLAAGETVLILGATSGVGSFAVQLVKALGGRAIATGRSSAKLDQISEMGNEDQLLLSPELGKQVHQLTEGRGAELVLDLVGGEWFSAGLSALRPQGRLVLVGLTAGVRCPVDLGLILRNRLQIRGSVLRSRSREEKAGLVSSFGTFAENFWDQGRLGPVIDSEFALEDAPRAYERLASGDGLGKVTLRTGQRR